MKTKGVPRNGCDWTRGDGVYPATAPDIVVCQQRRCSPWTFEKWLISREDANGDKECIEAFSSCVDLVPYVGGGPFPLIFRCAACYSHKDTKVLFYPEDDPSKVLANESGQILFDSKLVKVPDTCSSVSWSDG